MTKNPIAYNADRPLMPSTARMEDKLDRGGFARQAAAALGAISALDGVVVSIEGPWGCGKTSMLALIEDALRDRQNGPPIIIQFSPWIVGDRDALLTQFLARLGHSLKLPDRAADAKKVAREIDNYAKVFDALKLVPGAEPWATMFKSTMTGVGRAAGAWGSQKTKDIESQKQRLEEVLRTLNRPIVVIIDDVDRLYPGEVFEVIRIVKAVGDLPNVGYLLAYDPNYVTKALEHLGVPNANLYLDKIVQARLHVPALSFTARARLINAEYDALGEEIHKYESISQKKLVGTLFWSGMRDALDQPRDYGRVFNLLKTVEPELRGEVVFADLLAYSALSIKCGPIIELLRMHPKAFVGVLRDDDGLGDDSAADAVKSANKAREEAYEKCAVPSAARKIVQFLFPLVARAEGQPGVQSHHRRDARLSDADRLMLVLNFGLESGSVSVRALRRYAGDPALRAEIGATLTADNCLEFVERLGDVNVPLSDSDRESLCVDIASLVDSDACVAYAAREFEMIRLAAEHVASGSIARLLMRTPDEKIGQIADRIVRDERALTVAASILRDSFIVARNRGDTKLHVPDQQKQEAQNAFYANIVASVDTGRFYRLSNPGLALFVCARLMPSFCPELYGRLVRDTESADAFAVCVLHRGADSIKGSIFEPSDLTYAYVPEAALRALALKRVADASTEYPARAAWQSVIEGRSLYGIDGSIARD